MKGKTFSREKISVILLIILVALSVYLSQNRYKTLGALQERMDQEEQALSQEETRLYTLIEMRKQGPLYLEQQELFNNLIPKTAEVNFLLPYLQQTAELSQAKLLQVRFAAEKASDDYMELPLNLSYEISFHDLLKLLRNLREGDRAVRVDSLRLVQDNAASPFLRAELNGSVFYRKHE